MSRCFIHAFVFIVFCYPYLNVLSSISYQCHVLSVEFSCLYAFYTCDYYEMYVSVFPCLCMLFLYDFIYRFVLVSCFTCLLTGKDLIINFLYWYSIYYMISHLISCLFMQLYIVMFCQYLRFCFVFHLLSKFRSFVCNIICYYFTSIQTGNVLIYVVFRVYFVSRCFHMRPKFLYLF